MNTNIFHKMNTRKLYKYAGALLIVAVLASVAVIAVRAVTIGGYIIDGDDVPDTGATLFDDLEGAVAELGPVNGTATKLGVIHTAMPAMLGFKNPNSGVDMRGVWLDTNLSGEDVWLYFAWERDSNSGSGVLMYEFQQSPAPEDCDFPLSDAELASCNPWANRAPGDFIIVWDQQGNTINIIIRTFKYNDTKPADGDWDGNAAEPLYLDAGETLSSSVSAAATSSDGYFGEAAINLSETVFPETLTKCITYGNVIPGTVTGNSDTADFKDVVLANFGDTISISNCGSVKVIKDTDPEGLEGTFPFTLKRESGDIYYTGTDKTKQEGTLTKDGDFETYLDLISATNYQLSEGAVGPAFALTSIICVVDSTSYNVTSSTGTFPVKPSTLSTCTITNTQQPGNLIVKKLVVNDDGGTKVATDFSFQVNGGTAIPFIEDPDQDPLNPLMGKNTLSKDTGNYSVTEPAVTGYITTYSNSANSAANCTSLLVPAGGSVTCTITNDDVAPTLKLAKTVVTGDGGDAVAHDWDLTATGTVLGFTDYGDSSTFHNVKAGVEYTLSESTVFGYTPGSWSCDKSVVVGAGNKITLGVGVTGVTCTITNDDIAPTLKLVKSVTNDNGGTNSAGQWTLTATAAAGRNYSHPGDHSSFEAVYANVDYTLGESGPSNPTAVYDPGSWSCDHSVTVGAGNTITIGEGVTGVTCTITNDDTKASPDGTTAMSWVIYDTLNITGIRGSLTTARVTFKLFSTSDCSGTVIWTDPVLHTIVSNAATSGGYTVIMPVAHTITYYWQAHYSGDAYNNDFTVCNEATTIKDIP